MPGHGAGRRNGLTHLYMPSRQEECYVNHIVLCEHPHVYTLGRSGKEGNMLLGEEQLRRIGLRSIILTVAGDITYHGPGQLVCYPILNLEDFSLGLKGMCICWKRR